MSVQPTPPMTAELASKVITLVKVIGLKQHQAAALLGLNQGRVSEVMTGKRYLGVDVADLAVQSLMHSEPEDPLATLSARERQIITLVVNGQSSTQIGTLLHLSPKTVATYRSRLMAKLGVSDVPGLVRLAIRTRLIEADGP